MQHPVRITFHDVDRSEAPETHIREKVSRLEAFCARTIDSHVAVEMLHKHHGPTWRQRQRSSAEEN